MTHDEAQALLRANCLQIAGKPNSANKSRETRPRSEALNPAWWRTGRFPPDVEISPRGIAFFLSYLQIGEGRIPMDGLVLSDGYMWPDRAVIGRLDTRGFIQMKDGVITPTQTGLAFLAPYLAPDSPSFSASPETATAPDTGNRMQQPENLILYGPPGTGKTYATATEALRLCGEPVPASREEVMAAYNRLRAEKRIEFVTFHQSMSYEDFIEGRQPVTDGEKGAGFRLETVPGVFREISGRAATSRATGERRTFEGRGIWRFPLLQTDGEPVPHREDCLEEGRVRARVPNDIDWSSDRYSSDDAIMERLRQDDPSVHPTTWFAVEAKLIRNWMQPGDVVIAMDDLKRFLAVGIVESDYRYDTEQRFPGASSYRDVRWTWRSDTGRPISDITPHRIGTWMLQGMKVHPDYVPVIEDLISEEATGAPPPHVLIIDEINRANISKVFGELITLIEPDKRIGMPNALTVRLPYSGEDFGVPANLHILGTMNTADRSIALLDTALRRRFDFREVMPDPDALREAAGRCGLDLPRILTALNERIEYLYDREHRIGHAYFVNCASREEVDTAMRHKVIPLLAEYFFEDWSKVAAVLGDAAPHEGPIRGGFMVREVLNAPPGFDEDGDGAPRFRWSLREDGFSYERLAGR